MAEIVWNSATMSTGVLEVDRQHQEWIRRYNQFDEAVSQGKGIEAVHSALEFFSIYAEIHFKFEESVMNERHCSAAEDNHFAHEHMRSILRGYNAYANKHGLSIFEVAGLRQQMGKWLVDHILTIDIQLREVI
jgi:hemerythrin